MDGLGMAAQYKFILDECSPQLVAVLRRLTDPSLHPTLVCCSLGKDRTGLVSALLHALLGTPRHAILKDYSLSERELEPLRPRVVKGLQRVGLDPSVWSASPPHVMDAALGYVDARWGGVENFLSAHGFGAAEQRLLRDVLAAPSF